jgi:hypothetical protein
MHAKEANGAITSETSRDHLRGYRGPGGYSESYGRDTPGVDG